MISEVLKMYKGNETSRFANYGVYLFGHWLNLGRVVKGLNWIKKTKIIKVVVEFHWSLWYRVLKKIKETEASRFANYGAYLSGHWLNLGFVKDLGLKEKMQNQSKWSWNFTNLCDKVAETSRKMKRVDSPTMGCTSSGTGAISGLSRLLALKWQTNKHQRHIIINKQGGCETTGDLGCLKLDPRCWPRCNFFDVPLQFLVKGFFLSCLCQWNVVVDIKLVYWTNSLHKCRVGQVGTNKCQETVSIGRSPTVIAKGTSNTQDSTQVLKDLFQCCSFFHWPWQKMYMRTTSKMYGSLIYNSFKTSCGMQALHNFGWFDGSVKTKGSSMPILS